MDVNDAKQEEDIYGTQIRRGEINDVMFLEIFTSNMGSLDDNGYFLYYTII